MALILYAGAGATVAATNSSPNLIIIIIADDVGYGDVGCYGPMKIKTLNIDQLGNPLSPGSPCIGANQRDFAGSGRQRQPPRESPVRLSARKYETSEANK